MKKLWFLAALFIGFAAVGCSDDDDNNPFPENDNFKEMRCEIFVTASDDARKLGYYTGEITDFNGEVDDFSIELINYASSEEFSFSSFEDNDATASIRVNAIPHPDFVPVKGERLNVEFVIEVKVAIYGESGNKLEWDSNRKSKKITYVSKDGVAEFYASQFPKTFDISVTKVDDKYKISIE